MWFYTKIKYNNKHVGSYTLIKPIGEGRYGLCFLARLDNGQKVVIKKFKAGFFKRDYSRNISEGVILSRLKHKRIPELLGVIHEKYFYGFILSFMEGYTIKELLFKYKYHFSQEEFYDIGLQLISIIKYLHNNGIVHGDLSTSNVLLNDGEVYLLDFGLARYEDGIQYTYDIDFSYLADFLLYILYSSFDSKTKQKKLPWYEELILTTEQKDFLKILLRIQGSYENIEDVERDFIKVFSEASGKEPVCYSEKLKNFTENIYK